MTLISAFSRRLLIVVVATGWLGACSSLNPFSGGDKTSASNQGNTAVAVTADAAANKAGFPANPFMWQAALEAFGVMPLVTIDDVNGRIISGWHVPPGAPLERFRVNVIFSSRALRVESIAISIERQELGETGEWFSASVSPTVSRNMIDAILARALVLRQESGTL